MPKTNNDKRILEEFYHLFNDRFTKIAKMADKGDDYGYGKGLARLQFDIEEYHIKKLQQAREEERKDCEKKMKDWLEDFTYADGFVGFTDKEWVAIKRFIKLIQDK